MSPSVNKKTRMKHGSSADCIFRSRHKKEKEKNRKITIIYSKNTTTATMKAIHNTRREELPTSMIVLLILFVTVGTTITITEEPCMVFFITGRLFVIVAFLWIAFNFQYAIEMLFKLFDGITIVTKRTTRLSSSSRPDNKIVTTPQAGSKTSLTALEATTAATRRRTVLVTGGAGYIGSHTVLELLETQQKEEEGDKYYYEIVVVDNLSNSSEESLRRVQQITKCTNHRLHFRKCDIRDKEALGKVLDEFPNISSCIHFAGLKAVGESVQKPLEYYDNNIHGTIVLLQLLQQHGIKNFVFSSSATVYGQPETLPITEDAPVSATNPYGRTKLFLEEILRDWHDSDPGFWNILLLRYFNPIGAHPSGRIGEDPRGIPNNLMPYVAQVCVGRRPKLQIFGNDYPTIDGTGVRDYIHVVDLAKGHVAALERLYNNDNGGCCKAINLGTGRGISVLELVHGMATATNRKSIPYEIVGRRTGDVAEIYADPTLAREYLQWEATLNVTDMCNDTWRWQSKNPYGYNTAANSK